MNKMIEKSLIFGAGALVGFSVTKIILDKRFHNEMETVVNGLYEEFDNFLKGVTEVKEEVTSSIQESSKKEDDVKEFKTLADVYDEIVTTAINKDNEVVNNVFDNGDVEAPALMPPYLISGDEFLQDSSYEKIDLYYYEEDKILTDTKDKIIDNHSKFVGDALELFDDALELFHDVDDAIFVRNDALLTDYEVLRFHDSYESAVLGIDKE